MYRHLLDVSLFFKNAKAGVVLKFPIGILATVIIILSYISIEIILDTLVSQYQENIEILKN